jgi:hypothetical protein
MLAMKTLRGPNHPTRRGKAINGKMQLNSPHPDIHKPIDAGLMPSPPSSTDVDQTSGIRAIAPIPISAIMA